ncbi:FAD-dependent oxidoreductase [Candidatus Uhrbacteria bacterium]|nr:FAD-dependent oxidoreductase [Candidatus Uhrbacteria bacterium]
MAKNPSRIVIVGGGFGGVSCALALASRCSPNLAITLISDKPHLEYTAALYRVVAGRSPLEVCIPLRDIIGDLPIECVRDTAASIDPAKRTIQCTSGSAYSYDYAVLGLGSKIAYFGIPGMQEYSFNLKSISAAIRLQRHLHEMFEQTAARNDDRDDDARRMRMVIVGAGASGVELAGELASYLRILSEKHHVSKDFVDVDLIEASPRILPPFPATVARRVEQRLKELGVNIYANRTMVREELQEVILKGMTIKTETVVWTAGVKAHDLYALIPGIETDKKGRVVVDEYLRAKGADHLFIVGDGAATKYSGMAQTAIHDGMVAAENIIRSINGAALAVYHPKQPYYALPVGPRWAAAIVGPVHVYGYGGWILRRIADLRYFLNVLPVTKAFRVFREGRSICEVCDVCSPQPPP